MPTHQPSRFSWMRTSAMTQSPSARETWVCSREGKGGVALRESFDVDVRLGKLLDVRALKQTSLQETMQYAEFLAGKARDLYTPGKTFLKIEACPCCDATQFKGAFSIFDIEYVRCEWCGHAFVQQQPVIEELNEVFSDSEEHSSVYTDMRALEVRMQQVVMPKLEWVLDGFAARRGRKPETLVDIGAGAGHFVAGCRRSGLEADGYELSRSSRAFAKRVFDIDLLESDFLKDAPGAQSDVITMWGLLEYTPAPRAFLEAAKRYLKPDGMLVVEVPRFDCVSSAIQELYPTTVARHLDPTSHVNCFSDSSLLTALRLSGFKPVAAWYFGMDIYELFVQLSLNSGMNDLLDQFADTIPRLQASLDGGLVCDDLILLAEPVPGE